MNDSDIKKGVYQHYKGGIARVIDVAKHSETGEVFVAYYHKESETGKTILWVRPISMFKENVIIDKVEQPRFRYLREE
jgi:hypothetical protein